MAFLVRRVEQGKWKPRDDRPTEEIRADAVTSELRTSNDVLSFWLAGESGEVAKSELLGIALALAFCRDKIDQLDLIVLTLKLFEDAGLSVTSTEGETPLAKLRALHRDVGPLDLNRLAIVARGMAACVRTSQVTRFTVKEVEAAAKTALEKGQKGEEGGVAFRDIKNQKLREWIAIKWPSLAKDEAE